jgi:hypothetical protein
VNTNPRQRSNILGIANILTTLPQHHPSVIFLQKCFLLEGRFFLLKFEKNFSEISQTLFCPQKDFHWQIISGNPRAESCHGITELQLYKLRYNEWYAVELLDYVGDGEMP